MSVLTAISPAFPDLWYLGQVPKGGDSPADVQLEGDAVNPGVCWCSRALPQQGFRNGNPRGARALSPLEHPGRLYPKKPTNTNLVFQTHEFSVHVPFQSRVFFPGFLMLSSGHPSSVRAEGDV